MHEDGNVLSFVHFRGKVPNVYIIRLLFYFRIPVRQSLHTRRRKSCSCEWEHCSPSLFKFKTMVRSFERGLKCSALNFNRGYSNMNECMQMEPVLYWVELEQVFYQPILTAKDTQLWWFRYRILYWLLVLFRGRIQNSASTISNWTLFVLKKANRGSYVYVLTMKK